MKIHRNARWFLIKLLDRHYRVLSLEQYRQAYVSTGWDFSGYKIPGRVEFRDMIERLDASGLIEVENDAETFWQCGYALTSVGMRHAYCSMIYNRNDHRYRTFQNAA